MERATTSALLELRGWRKGTTIGPGGAHGIKRSRKCFREARIPSWKRGFWPIVTNGSKILWAREFGAAAEAAERRLGEAGGDVAADLGRAGQRWKNVGR